MTHEAQSQLVLLHAGAAAIAGGGTSVHCHAAEATTPTDEEMPTGATAVQAAATVADDMLVGSDASPRPAAHPSKKKQSKSLPNPATCIHALAWPGRMQIHARADHASLCCSTNWLFTDCVSEA